MSEPGADEPRYTWVSDATSTIVVLRRSGLFSQEKVAVIINPNSNLSLQDEQSEIANAICDYLERRDRERRERGQ